MDGYPVTVRFPMHWGELDALGHANNTRYFVWFESARIETFQRIGVTADRPTNQGPILATTSCDFLRPLRWPADLVVGARIPRIGRTSFTMEYAVALQDSPDDHIARGSGVIVLIDYETGAKVEVDGSLRERIAAL
jgi:acyl-CoA thioester hydrolase